MAIIEASARRAEHVWSLALLRRRVPLAWVQLSVLVAFLGVLPIGEKIDPDFWWHLRVGQIVVDSGIPRHDSFSWTAGGNAWVAHEWLSEAIIYAVQSVFGYAGNVVVFGLATAGSLCLMYAAARRGGAGRRLLV